MHSTRYDINIRTFSLSVTNGTTINSTVKSALINLQEEFLIRIKASAFGGAPNIAMYWRILSSGYFLVPVVGYIAISPTSANFVQFDNEVDKIIPGPQYMIQVEAYNPGANPATLELNFFTSEHAGYATDIELLEEMKSLKEIIRMRMKE